MKLDRTDALVLLIGVASLGTALGSLLDFWPAVYYSLPLLTVVFMLMGSLSIKRTWHTPNLVLIGAYCAVFIGLFIAAQVLIDSTDTLGGLPLSTAIFVYMIWPYTAIGAPLVYAAVHKSWLMKDFEANPPAAPAR